MTASQRVQPLRAMDADVSNLPQGVIDKRQLSGHLQMTVRHR
ncbi:hypothetical protein ACFJIX_19245 [Roseateles sp. UC29_93]